MNTDAGSAFAGNPAGSPAEAGGMAADAGINPAGASGAARAPGNDIFSGLDAEARAFAENKGWHKDRNPVGAVLKSYRELESRVGNSLPLPAEGDADGWRKFYAKAGMPETPDGYGFATPDLPGAQADAQVLGGIFHQAGLSKAQAGRVYEAYAGLISAELEKREQQDRAGASEAQAAIAELGGARMEGAQAAFARFVGAEDAELQDKLTQLMGDARLIHFFDRLAQSMGEDGKGDLGMRSGGHNEKPETFRHLVDRAYEKQG